MPKPEWTSSSEWQFERCTTDKLLGVLNELSDSGFEIRLIQFIGSRDWLILYVNHEVEHDPDERS